MSIDQLYQIKSLFQQRLQNNHTSLLLDSHHQRAHVAIIIHCNQFDQLSLITIKRVEHPLDPWSGHIALPGGMAKTGEGPLEVVLREVEEELSLTLEPEAFLGHLDSFETIGRKHHKPVLVRPEIFFVPRFIDIATLQAQPSEVEQISTWSFQELLDPKRATYYPFKKENAVFKLPGRRLEDGIMWGLTYRILTQFFEQLVGLPADLKGQAHIQLHEWEQYPDSTTLKKYTTRSE